MKHWTNPALRSLALVFAASVAIAQTPGHANFNEYTSSSFDGYTDWPNTSQQQWFQNHYSSMVVFAPYFDSRTWWFPNAYVYKDLYGVFPGSWIQFVHPDWIMHDQFGNWLYIPFNCGGGTCPTFAGNIANAGFRANWINEAYGTLASGNYPGLFIDDVNMNFNVSDGWGNLVQPIDENTGSLMDYNSWRYYMATFMEQIRASFPNTKLMENSIWYAGPSGTRDSDPYVQRQIATANTINMERGIANDAGLTGGTGPWSVYAYFNYIDRVHAAGKSVNFQEYTLSPAGQQYGLASYFLISSGSDSIGDYTSTPGNWWSGYDVNIGWPSGPRTYNNGIFRRNFSGGMVLLGEPGLPTQTVNLGGTYTLLDGTPVTAVTLSGWQGIVLLGSSATTGGGGGNTGTNTTVTTSGGVNRYLSDIAPTYAVTGWGTVQSDRSVLGRTLNINGTNYAKGLGVHAYSELHYALWGNCTSLTAAAGVDSEVPSGIGWVDFQVWADGYLLYDSGFVTSGSPAANVNIDLTGRQQLGLVVTNGIYMAPSWTTYDDHADWANPILTCNN